MYYVFCEDGSVVSPGFCTCEAAEEYKNEYFFTESLFLDFYIRFVADNKNREDR